jgi:hypothetical protein
LGSYIVSRLPLPNKSNEELTTKLIGESNEEQLNINVLNVGYDQSKLVPVIDALTSGDRNIPPIAKKTAPKEDT